MAQPIFNMYQTLAPKLSWQVHCLEVLGFSITSVGTVLAFFRLFEWVVFVVAVGTVVNNFTQYLALDARLAAVNRAVRDLQNLFTWWDALSIVDRRTRRAKDHAVRTCEGAVLNEVTMWTRSAVQELTDLDAGPAAQDNKENESQSLKKDWVTEVAEPELGLHNQVNFLSG